MKNVIVCSPKSLPASQLIVAARKAVEINPHNHPPLEHLALLVPGFRATPARIAVLTKKYWGIGGVKLTVSFLDNPPADLRKRILLHMNAWAETANVKFTASNTDPQVRIARAGGQDGGYWSYVGTDILSIKKNEATMNLEAFSMETPESEYHRVVRHETGHTLGFPHEHMRRALVEKLDRQKTIDYFMATQGWTEEEVIAQVLTPIEESALMSTAADPRSIMCYQIPAQLTKDGKPIVGGKDIDRSDSKFAATIYPKKTVAVKKATKTAAPASKRTRK
ncbi:MAG: Astacin [Bryobacterales bacterium]|jgi:hypothetical protein|nr:Astacin [Bryobacterales bacterium]